MRVVSARGLTCKALTEVPGPIIAIATNVDGRVSVRFQFARVNLFHPYGCDAGSARPAFRYR